MATSSLARQLSHERSEMMTTQLEAVALRLFEERGFDVTVDEIATEAGISHARSTATSLRRKTCSRSGSTAGARPSAQPLASRPVDGPTPPIPPARRCRRWSPPRMRSWAEISAHASRAAPTVLKAVVGGIQLKSHRVTAEFLGTRLGLPADALVPVMLAATVEASSRQPRRSGSSRAGTWPTGSPTASRCSSGASGPTRAPGPHGHRVAGPGSTPNGIRTRVTCVKGRRPRPLDDGGPTEKRATEP